MAEVNYLPNPASPIETPPFFYSDSTIAGYGSPEGVVPAWPGTHYTDRDNGDTYIKQSGDGTLTGWAQEAGGGGGGAGLTYYQGAFLDPNGNQTGSVGDVYKSRISLGGDGTVWWKETGNNTNTGWGA